MSARRQIVAALSEDSMGGIATLQDVVHAEQLADALTAEVRAEDIAILRARAEQVKGTRAHWSAAGIRQAVIHLEKAATAAAAPATPDAEAYPGELAMLRGLFRTLRVVVRADDDVAEVRRLLHQHAGDDAAARAEAKEGKTATTSGDATPFFQPGRTYTEPSGVTDWKFRVDSVTTHPEDGERTALGWRHFRGEWEPYAYGEDDWEIHQLADISGPVTR